MFQLGILYRWYDSTTTENQIFDSIFCALQLNCRSTFFRLVYSTLFSNVCQKCLRYNFVTLLHNCLIYLDLTNTFHRTRRHTIVYYLPTLHFPQLSTIAAIFTRLSQPIRRSRSADLCLWYVVQLVSDWSGRRAAIGHCHWWAVQPRHKLISTLSSPVLCVDGLDLFLACCEWCGIVLLCCSSSINLLYYTLVHFVWNPLWYN